MPVDFGIRILLVDDMPAMRSILRGMLEEIGYQNVVEVEDGDIAWQAIQSSVQPGGHLFELIIADWNMPGMSGVDLLRAVRNLSPTRALPFFMVTARGDGAHIQEATRAGVTDYLVKPFAGAELAAKLSKLFLGTAS